MKTAVIYTRVSTLRQAEEGHSLDAQEQEVLQYAKNKGMDVLRVFREEGKSGKNNNREELKEMLAFAKQNQVETLLVYKLSRLSRKVSGLLQIIEELSSYGTHVEFVNDGIDTSNQMGKLITTILGAVAEMERENILEYSKMGQINNAREGRSNGSHVLGYSHVDKKLVTDENSDIVLRIFELYANEGCGTFKIAGLLNAQGLKSNRGFPFTSNNIRNILRNEKYIGTLNWKDKKAKTTYTTKNAHTPIVPLELWEKAQILLSENRTDRLYKGEFILSGILRCPQCGGRTTGYTTTGINKNSVSGTTKKYNYYRCDAFAKSGKSVCSNNLIRKDKIEAEVIGQITKLVDNKNFLRRLIEKANSINREDAVPLQRMIENMEKEIKKLEKEKTNMYEEKMAGNVSTERFNDFMNYLEKKEGELKSKKREAEMELNKITVKVDIDSINEAFEKIRKIESLSWEKKREVLRAVISSIELNQGPHAKDRTLLRINYRFAPNDKAKSKKR